MRTKKSVTVFGVLGLAALFSSSARADWQDYHRISGVEIREVSDAEALEYESEWIESLKAQTRDVWIVGGITLPGAPDPGTNPGTGTVPGTDTKPGTGSTPPVTGGAGATNPLLVDIQDIINIGKQIWDIVKENRPVVNIETDSASAMPAGVTHWSQLEGWQAPKSRLLKMTYKNGYNSPVVDFAFRVLYTYGGSVEGKGAYLSNVTIVPARVKVAWGYQFNAKAKVPNVTNAGTSKKPVAAAEMLLTWSVDSMLVHMQDSVSYYVKADGSFLDLTNGNQ